MSKYGNLYTGFMLRTGVNDATAGYRAFRAQTLLDIDYAATRAKGYGFQIELAYRVSPGGREDRRDPDHLHRPRARLLEDVDGGDGRGDGPRQLVGHPRPLPAPPHRLTPAVVPASVSRTSRSSSLGFAAGSGGAAQGPRDLRTQSS